MGAHQTKQKRLRKLSRVLRKSKTEPSFDFSSSTASIRSCPSFSESFDDDATTLASNYDLSAELKRLRYRIRVYDGNSSDDLGEIRRKFDQLEANEMVRDRIQRYRAIVDVKRQRSVDKQRQTVRREYYNRRERYIEAMFAHFNEIASDLATIKADIVAYFGTSQDDEYNLICERLAACERAVREVNTRGDIRIIITVEEYEDYIERMRASLHAIIAENERRFNQCKDVLTDVYSKRRKVRRKAPIMFDQSFDII